MNCPVIFLSKGTNVHPRLRDTNLVTRYGFSEVSCVITNISECIDDKAWEMVVKVVFPGIRKMKVRSVACVLTSSIFWRLI